MSLKIGILMDPIAHINIKKDSTFAMLLAAQARGHALYYLEAKNIFLENNIVTALTQKLTVKEHLSNWFDLTDSHHTDLNSLDILLMRKDPPFNMQYIYLTYLLELAEKKGLFVVNKPASLRDANEKMFINWFPHCTPKTLVTSSKILLQKFVKEKKCIVIKPLDGMAGRSVFRLTDDDMNRNTLIEMITQNETQFVMAQQFIPEVREGDKRIILINGEAIPYALARLPAEDDFRGNLAAGAKGEIKALSERDRWICAQVGPTLKEKGLFFVGLDVIGDYLTEINVTSPTGIREIEAATDLNIAQQFIIFLEEKFSREK